MYKTLNQMESVSDWGDVLYIGRACDFFDLFVPFVHLTRCSTPPQNRHPERSAAQIRRIKKGLGAESKDPGDACWQMLF
jgi:hypothetical protein